MTSNSTKVVKGLKSQTIVTLMLGIVEIVTFSILSRLLNKEDFGYYAAISAVTMIFNSFSEAGIGSAIIQQKNYSDNYRNTAFSVSLVIGLCFSMLLFVSSGILSRLVVGEALQKPLMIMSIVILCHSMVSVNVSQMKKKLMFLRVGILDLFSRLVAAIFAIYFAYIGLGLYAIIINTVLHSVLYLILSRIAVGGRYRLAFHNDQVRSIVSFGGWLTASVVLRNICQQMDKLMMSRLLSVESLGSYNRPKELLSNISSKLNSIFDTVLFPVLSGVQEQINALQSAFHKSLYFLNVFSTLLALSFITNHELVIRIFLGEKWLSTAPVFVILSFAFVANVNNRLSDCFFRSLALVKYQFYIRILHFVIVVVAIVLGSFFGLVGVAVAYLSAGVVVAFYKVLFIARRINVPVHSAVKSLISGWKFVLFAAPVCCAMLFLLPHSVTGNIVLFLIYCLLVLSLFIFSPQTIGERYKDEVYPKLIDFILRRK